jgi:hypothetical protein
MADVRILDVFNEFAFSIIDAPLDITANAVRHRGAILGGEFSEKQCELDARAIYFSPYGPHNMPAIIKGILLSEVDGPRGKKTLFLSSVADGYNSMVHVLSKVIAGTQFSIRLNRKDDTYPAVFFAAISNGETIRVVYTMKDGAKWVFFEKGTPFPFEEVERYSERIKRNRLTHEMICAYLERIGYGSLSKEYWMYSKKPALLLADEGFIPWNESVNLTQP